MAPDAPGPALPARIEALVRESPRLREALPAGASDAFTVVADRLAGVGAGAARALAGLWVAAAERAITSPRPVTGDLRALSLLASALGVPEDYFSDSSAAESWHARLTADRRASRGGTGFAGPCRTRPRAEEDVALIHRRLHDELDRRAGPPGTGPG
ncbi:hypothetical protein Ae168Ps1_2889 [Pseudonocardia sp. Ae168_Ps1]|uniref:hypothetical protein n=1 Tax=unclassified Pseudonocardia TaxID=2619320 RepID=UPI00095A16A0|nr:MULTISPECIES: hypothetical protein [unclassified Pseudonocardia]OLL74503.1 hypothetical protein Ae150APs1_2881 [Pseudonocardia sp. Ae150A_Ps1]OLL80483.1 hypothetical protein Ae168Ps1_2889 [Pseudonocardia sp. Ae168_Ps1]OLL85390.1 hypothetical protein Ae263Ps1_2445c [Pseudonocardia sp. Ae263_Ps1]OLL94583.1 hypothetical protein Ae356Ps1_4480 [Pseudonocardia sp. Ae356_Ps1]